jgi:hypothetical protein
VAGIQSGFFFLEPAMRRFLLASLIAFTCVSLAACSKVSKQNYDRLKMGQTYAEVVELLGDPSQCDAVLIAKNCQWGQEPKTISVNFVGDKVVLFSSSGL